MADGNVPPAKSLFEALTESAPDAIVTIDTESMILSANVAVRRVFGYDAADLIGKSLTMLMPERLRAQHDRGMARYMESGAKNVPWNGVQFIGLTRDQREIPIEISFGEFVDPTGRRVLSGFIKDISERAQQQGELQAALEDVRMQALLLASVEQAIVSTDLTGTVLTWNQYAETLYGWSAEEALGRSLNDLLGPGESSEEVAGAIWSLRRGRKVTYERQVRRRDGDAIWISVIAAPIRDASGRVTRVVGTSTDISERRRLEEQFLQAQKMEAIGRLAGGVAHDFNNLLTVINAHAEFLLPQVTAGTEAAADVLEIAKAATRAAALTRQLLAFSRQQRLEQKPLDVNTVITDLERMLSRLIGEHIALTMDLAIDVPVILADHGQLEQAIVNLVVNARDAMPGGGTIRIGARRVVLSDATPERPAGTYAAIAVVDQGHGMTPDVRERIFEPFFTTKEPGKGTGLGLATVYGIIKQSRGFVDVESAADKGSTFTIYLPATQRAAAVMPSAAVAPISRGTETVLLVEDQEAVRTVAARILARNGYRVLEAADGIEALAILDGSPDVDLVLTDAVMPRLGGSELLRTVRLTYPHLPFVIMSGYTGDALATNDDADARTVFLQKPFKLERLLAAVREAIGPAKKSSPKAQHDDAARKA